MTITVTSIDQGPFTATGLSQTVAYTFMTLTDEEISVFYDSGAGRVLIDPASRVVTRNKNIDGSAKEGGSVELAVAAAPAGSNVYLRAAPRADRDLVWSDTGSRLKNLNEEQDRMTLRLLVTNDTLSRNIVGMAEAGADAGAAAGAIAAGLVVDGRALVDGSNTDAEKFRASTKSAFAGFHTLYLVDFGGVCDGVTDDGQAWTDLHAELSNDPDVLNVVKWDGRSRCARQVTATNANIHYDGGQVLFTAAAGGFVINQTDNRIYAQRFVSSSAQTEFLTNQVGLHTPVTVNYRFIPYAFKYQAYWQASATVENNDAALGQCWKSGPTFRNLMVGFVEGDLVNGHDASNSAALAGFTFSGFCVGVKLMPGAVSYCKRGVFVDPLRAWIINLSGAGGFIPDDNVTGSVSGAVGVAIRGAAGVLFVADASAPFRIGETVTGTNGATGTITGFSEYVVWSNPTGGAVANGETWTGATSGATFTVDAVGVDDDGRLWAQINRTSTAQLSPGETMTRAGKTALVVEAGRRPYGGEGFYLSDTEFVGTEHSIHIDCRYAAKLFTGFEIRGWHSNGSKGAAYLYGVLQFNSVGGILYPLTSDPAYVGIKAIDCDEFSLTGGTFANGQAGQTALSVRGTSARPQVVGVRATGSYGTGLYRGASVLGGLFVGNDFANCTVPRTDAGLLFPGAGAAVYGFNLGIPDTNRPAPFYTLAANSSTPTVSGETDKQKTANTSATTITSFLGVVDGMAFSVLVDDGNTSIQHNATQIMKGATTVAVPNGGIIHFQKYGSILREVGRNF